MLGTRCLVLPILAISALAQNVPTDPLEIPGSNTPNRSATYPNIVLVTLDTTRADRMDFLGSKRGLTPNLDLTGRGHTLPPRNLERPRLFDSSICWLHRGGLQVGDSWI
jgi:hypothetical protein